MDESIKTLLSTENKSLIAFTKRNLLGEDIDLEELWTSPQAQRILGKQRENGSWLYPNKKAGLHSTMNYNQYQTYKTLAELVEFYGFTIKHEAIRRAAEYLFSFQTSEGEFKGIYGNQYSPNYSASITEFLIKSGYKGIQVERSLNWLLNMRHDDGGWAIPFRTKNRDLDSIAETETIEPDKTKPFSHLVTGIVLRPFSLLAGYRVNVMDIGLKLVDRVFTRDKYPDRVGIEYWTKFTYPYHWTDILSTVDTLTLIGINNHPKLNIILGWFKKHRRRDGIYDVNVMAGAKYRDVRYWITLQYLSVLRRSKLYNNN